MKKLRNIALLTFFTLSNLGLFGCIQDSEHTKGEDGFDCYRERYSYIWSDMNHYEITAKREDKKIMEESEFGPNNHYRSIITYKNIFKEQGDKILKSCEDKFIQMDKLKRKLDYMRKGIKGLENEIEEEKEEVK